MDAVKFQKRNVSKLAIKSVLEADDNRFPEFGKTYEEVRNHIEFNKEEYQELKDYCEDQGIQFLCTAFDIESVDFLEDLNCPVYKVAAPEITDIPLLKKIGQTEKPVVVSTGLATLSDIDLAVQTLRQHGSLDVVLLKCTTAYPTPFEEINLRTIPHLAETFQCLVGLSDHTLGIGVAVASICLGAKVIEKHFVLDKNEGSVDGFFSMEPDEFRQMVEEVRKVEKGIGVVNYDITPAAQKNLNGRRSLYVSADIKNGERFTVDNVKSVRPSCGLHPKYLDSILGKRANRDLSYGDRLSWDMIDVERETKND